jgi:hypothetical protein
VKVADQFADRRLHDFIHVSHGHAAQSSSIQPSCWDMGASFRRLRGHRATASATCDSDADGNTVKRSCTARRTRSRQARAPFGDAYQRIESVGSTSPSWPTRAAMNSTFRWPHLPLLSALAHGQIPIDTEDTHSALNPAELQYRHSLGQ